MLCIKVADSSLTKSKREEWNNLVYKMKRPSVFCTWEWINKWNEHYGNVYEPLILFVYRNDRLIGILPLAKKFENIEDCLFPVRVISYCGSNELHSDHIDILCKEEDADQCMNAIALYFKKDYIDWDVIELSHIPEDGRIIMMKECFKSGYAVEHSKVSSAPYIYLDGTFEDYCMRMSGDRRRELRRTMRVLYGRENVKLIEYDPAEKSYGFKELFDLHNMRQNRKGVKSSFKGDNLLEYHESIAKEFYQLGWLRLFFLCHLDKPVAAIYGYDYGGRHFGYQMGIHPEWERRSVGSVLLYEMIEYSYGKKLVEFDFLRGGEHYKGKWTENSRDLFTVHIFRSNLLGTAAKSYMNIRTSLKNKVKKLTDL